MKSDRAEKQQILFEKLCSPYDLSIILGVTKISIKDFFRIGYILHCLGLEDYEAYFFFKFSCELDENQMMKYSLSPLDEKIMEQHNRWLRNFCNNAPTEKIKYYLLRRFNLS